MTIEIIGAPGVGKTTISRLLTGLDILDEGPIHKAVASGLILDRSPKSILTRAGKARPSGIIHVYADVDTVIRQNRRRTTETKQRDYSQYAQKALDVAAGAAAMFRGRGVPVLDVDSRTGVVSAARAIRQWLGKANCLVLGGAKCVWDDVSRATEIGEFHGVVACNDVGAEWRGRLDAWVSLHSEKMPEWSALRRRNGFVDPDLYVVPENWESRVAGQFQPDMVLPHRMNTQRHGGSSGLFAVKVAIEALGFSRAVCCGIPMSAEEGHFFDPAQWTDAERYRRGWIEAKEELQGRVRSMSGWTADLLGRPDSDWLALN